MKNLKIRAIWVICCTVLMVGMSVPAMAYKATVQNTTMKPAQVDFQYVAIYKSTYTVCQSFTVTLAPQQSFSFDPAVFIGSPVGLMIISVAIDGQTFFKYADGSTGVIPQCLPSPGWSMDTSWKITGNLPSYSLDRIQ